MKAEIKDKSDFNEINFNEASLVELVAKDPVQAVVLVDPKGTRKLNNPTKFAGTVVFSNTPFGWIVGDHETDWNKTLWKPFNGSIKLTND